ncbi:MAG: enoyl-CoA hydratase/isomerase family protein [Ardenticatenia bacterium]|nr:enoyl-CoA hydratase/isomerase family protein [Ardenticatenia bacterium]
MSDTLLYAVENGVATLTLNRPDKLNAFDDALLGALDEALRAAEKDPAVRCVVLTGAGRGFSAGQDLAAVAEREASGKRMSLRQHLDRSYNRVIRKIRGMEKPVIAAVNGVAAGAGMSLALACDLRIAAQSARFIQSFIGVGLVPDSGSTWFLPHMLGFSRAFQLAITAERLGAEDAMALGLVNQVVPDGDLAAETRAMAERLAAAPTRAIGLTKRAMNRAMASTLDEALDYEAILQDLAGRSEDHKEGVAAFMEKRPPEFKGR